MYVDTDEYNTKQMYPNKDNDNDALNVYLDKTINK